MSNQHLLSLDEKSLYNSAFTGYLLYSAIREYNDESEGLCSVNLAFIIIPLAVNKIFSSRLPGQVTTSLDKWIGDYSGFLVLIPELLEGYVPIVIDAIEFLIVIGAVSLDEDGDFHLVSNKISKDPALFKKSTDMKESLRAAKFLGKWLSRVDSDASLYAKLGVRP